jgi:D-alanyl-lipoteichoic acid acyltransferase DltB (MBOAT superfamily)
MPLNSHVFLLLFLPIVAALHARVSGRPSLRAGFLIASSVVFYSWAGPASLALLLAMIALTFAAARALGSEDALRRRLGLALLAGNLAVLALFKYADALAGSLGLQAPRLDGALPLGLSFYTFNLISHGLDVYWGRSEPAPLGALTAYATCFPTVSSGPLVREADFRAQAAVPTALTADAIDTAVFRIAMGLAKKALVADSIGAVVDPLFADHRSLGLAGAWVAVLGQHFRVYFDFSGYTDIAMGAALLVGVRVPPNFDAPYTARSLTEFWQRWHMTLSAWFRDYVFMPTAMFLRGLDPRRRPGPARSLALVVTMVLIGLWHAPTAPYLVWGLGQGAILAVHASLRARGRAPWPEWAGRLATFAALMLGWALLRSTDLAMAGSLFAALAGLRGTGTLPVAGVTPAFLAGLAALLVVTNLPREVSALEPRRSWSMALLLAVLLTLAVLATGGRTPFVYLQF